MFEIESKAYQVQGTLGRISVFDMRLVSCFNSMY